MINKALLTAGLAGALCLSAWAQENPRFEAGLTGGAGGYSYIDDHPYTRGVVGVEICAYCGGRFALFGGYSHFLPPGAPSGYQAADLIEGGLRIQGRRRVRPFFDAGVAVGYSRFGTSIRTLTTAGAALGFGVMIPAGPHLYIRPQARLYIMSQQYVAAAAEIGLGWRF